MPNTYTQIYIQIVFAVQGRQNLIQLDRKEELQKYSPASSPISGKSSSRSIACQTTPISSWASKPNLALSELVSKIKTGSTNHINEQKWVLGRYSWQEGFGAFSYSHAQLTDVIRYIQNQVEHYSRRTFRDEYIQFLNNFDVPFETKYLFEYYE